MPVSRRIQDIFTLSTAILKSYFKLVQSIFLKQKCFELRFKNVEAGTVFNMSKKIIPGFWPSNGKGAVSLDNTSVLILSTCSQHNGH